MAIIIQKAVKHIILSCQAEISGKTYEVLTTFYAKQTQFKPGDGFSARLVCGDGGKKIKRAGYQGYQVISRLHTKELKGIVRIGHRKEVYEKLR